MRLITIVLIFSFIGDFVWLTLYSSRWSEIPASSKLEMGTQATVIFISYLSFFSKV